MAMEKLNTENSSAIRRGSIQKRCIKVNYIKVRSQYVMKKDILVSNNAIT